MRASSVTASVFTALLLAAALPLAGGASAADLYGDGYGEPPYDENGYAEEEGYPYDEGGPPPPRYGGRYGEAPPPDRYSDAYGADAGEPPPGSIKDGYPVPIPPPARYGEREIAPPPRHVRPPRYACLDRGEIRHRLRAEGWTDIRPLGGDGSLVALRARRYESGRAFRLTVDRCSGAVLTARPQYLRSFALGERPWPHRRWSRRY